MAQIAVGIVSFNLPATKGNIGCHKRASAMCWKWGQGPSKFTFFSYIEE